MVGVGDLLNRIVDKINKVLMDKDSAREELIKRSRDVIRLSRSIVSAVLQGTFDRAATLITTIESSVAALKRIAEPHPELMYSGLVYNALAEFVEAELFYSIVAKRVIPQPEELGVHYIPYLQGLCDAVGELKRYILKLIKERKFDSAEELLAIAEQIFLSVQPLAEYPDALVPGLRRKIDIMRKVLDDLEKFILDLRSRDELIAKLEGAKAT